MRKHKSQYPEDWGYGNIPDKYVCAKMFPHQKFIREKIENAYNEGICNYCGEQSSVLPLENIVEMIYNEFEHYFDYPGAVYPLASKEDSESLRDSGFHLEGIYAVPNDESIMTTKEALETSGFLPASNELMQDICNCFYNNEWSWNELPFEKASYRMKRNWNVFWESTIKDKIEGISYDKIRAKHEYLLDYLCQNIESNLYSLKTEIPNGCLLYRCVNYKDIPDPIKAENLWAPPVEFATSQRMSKDGQSRFYASFDKDTPLREAVSWGKDKRHCLGTFSLKESINVLDFTNIQEANILNVPDFVAYRFFRDFANAITLEVGEDEKEKYVPTQLMRDTIEDKFMREGILGIKYRSVKGDNTNNVVLFLDNQTCGDYLKLEDVDIF